MFELLPASGPAGRPPVWQGVVSIVVHLGLAVGAVQATRAVATGVIDPMGEPPELIWVPPVVAPPAVTLPSAEPRSAVIAAGPPLQTISPPTHVPVGIPPIDLGERFDPRAFTGRGREPAPPEGSIPGDVLGRRGAVLDAQEVDLPVVALDLPRPAYPPTLRQLGVSGYVEAMFVVDTLGRAEPDSWSVLNSTHPLFEAPVRTSVMAGRFDPARVRGQAVRQLVRQRFSFTIDR